MNPVPLRRLECPAPLRLAWCLHDDVLASWGACMAALDAENRRRALAIADPGRAAGFIAGKLLAAARARSDKTSVAHSSKASICAYSPRALGVDLEPLTGMLSPMPDEMTQDEREAIARAGDPAEAFLAVWTAKEAIFKLQAGAVGLGRIDAAFAASAPLDWSATARPGLVLHAGRLELAGLAHVAAIALAA